jgi:hypothetical protein
VNARGQSSSADLLATGATLVASRLNEDPEVITGARKGSPATAFARQILAYLLNTEAGLDKQAVGTLLGRHRSTIGNAIEVVEDYRDTADGVIIDDLAKAFRLALPPTPAPAVMPTRRLSDPLTSAITAALVAQNLFRAGDSITTEREGSRVKINITLRVSCAGSRSVDEAHVARRLAIKVAEGEGYAAVFSDVLYAAKGATGWSVSLRLRKIANH